jgi:hypothetical protein
MKARSLHIVIPITRGLERKIEKVGGGGQGEGFNKKIYISPKIF